MLTDVAEIEEQIRGQMLGMIAHHDELCRADLCNEEADRRLGRIEGLRLALQVIREEVGAPPIGEFVDWDRRSPV